MTENRRSDNTYTLSYLGDLKHTLPKFTSWEADLSFGAQIVDLEQSTGDFSFTLEDSVKHPIAGTEDNLLLDFGVTAGTDGDGDVAAGSIKINVNDDVPESLVRDVLEQR